MFQARFFSASDNGAVTCGLCPHLCRLQDGAACLCRVRVNRSGRMTLPFAGVLTGAAIDPIEKKPLYHYRPGSSIFSVGFSGCNLRCPFCQNYHISQSAEKGFFTSPAELISAVQTGGVIAYTYSEPLVHIEYLLECMTEAHKRGIANVLVSNGTVNAGAAKEVLDLTDAANIDLKCFNSDTYKNILGGELETVKNFIGIGVNMNVHTEITTLIVPHLNDSEKELASSAAFISDLSPSIPWHLSAYHPAYRYSEPATEAGPVIKAARRAKEKLQFVYTGNIAPSNAAAGSSLNDTLCPGCGAALVKRQGYRTDTAGLTLRDKTYYCASCGKIAPVIY